MEENELIKMKIENIEEFLIMLKDYLEIYFKLLLQKFSSQMLRKELLKYLQEYRSIIKEENRYIRFIIQNNKDIQNIEALYKILDALDLLNERTYKYYQSILVQCEEMIEQKKEKTIYNKREFTTLTETSKYREELLGLLLTTNDLDRYYQDEVSYQYLKHHTKVLNVNEEEGIPYFGCFLEEENNKLKELNLCVPKITNLKTMLINIHEFKHGIALYPYLGKKIPIYNYEKEAKEEEQQFISQYLLKKNKIQKEI